MKTIMSKIKEVSTGEELFSTLEKVGQKALDESKTVFQNTTEAGFIALDSIKDSKAIEATAEQAEKAKETILEKKAKVDEAAKTFEALNQQNRKLSNAITTKDAEIMALKKQLSEQKAKFDKEVETVQHNANVEVTAAQKTVKSERDKRKELNRTVNELKLEIAQGNEQIKTKDELIATKAHQIKAKDELINSLEAKSSTFVSRLKNLF